MEKEEELFLSEEEEELKKPERKEQSIILEGAERDLFSRFLRGQVCKKLEFTACYAGLILAPAEGFGVALRAYSVIYSVGRHINIWCTLSSLLRIKIGK